MTNANPASGDATATTTGETTGEVEKTYTESEMLKRLQGSGKQIKTQESELEKLRAKVAEQEAETAKKQQADLESQGKFKELLAVKTTEHETLTAQLLKSNQTVEGFLKERQDRATAVEEQNKVRLEALPENLRELVHDSLDPDAKASTLARLEALHGQQVKSVDGRVFPGPVQSSKPLSEAEAFQQREATSLAHMLGKSKKQ